MDDMFFQQKLANSAKDSSRLVENLNLLAYEASVSLFFIIYHMLFFLGIIQ